MYTLDGKSEPRIGVEQVKVITQSLCLNWFVIKHSCMFLSLKNLLNTSLLSVQLGDSHSFGLPYQNPILAIGGKYKYVVTKAKHVSEG